MFQQEVVAKENSESCSVFPNAINKVHFSRSQTAQQQKGHAQRRSETYGFCPRNFSLTTLPLPRMLTSIIATQQFLSDIAVDFVTRAISGNGFLTFLGLLL